MKVAVIAVTGKGIRLGQRVAAVLSENGHEPSLLAPADIARETPGAEPLAGPLGSVMGKLFENYRGLVMVMAMGIVIRTIAPHLRDKRTDPAVVVMDEAGSFAVSAVSGHVGGANDLARTIARELGCQAVITTATDVNGVPAVDVLARDCHLVPENPERIKGVNAALARGEDVPVFSQFRIPLPREGPLVEMQWAERDQACEGWRVLITGQADYAAGGRDLVLRPQNLVAGVGCKRGVSRDQIMAEIKSALDSAGLSPLCVWALATIEARTSEEGLVEAAREMGVALLGFSPLKLNEAMDRHSLIKSDRVMDRMGVGGVCEPAAMLACRMGKLLVPKRKGNGITVALAGEESGWWE